MRKTELRKKDPKLLKRFREGVCVVCGFKSDPCHIKSVGSGGHDEESNLISLSRREHQEQHRMGFVHMYNKYPSIRDELERKGWTVEDKFNRKRLVRKE